MNRRGFFSAACGVVLGLMGVKAAKADPPITINGIPVQWQHYTFTYPDEEVWFSHRWIEAVTKG